MSTLDLIPDAKLLACDWLREHDDIIALDANVAPRTPAKMSKPWVRVTLLIGQDYPRAQIGHLRNFTLQFDCYAGDTAMTAHAGPAMASLLGLTVLRVVESWRATTRDGVAVSSVHATHMDGTDLETEPAHDRHIVIADVRMHPVA